MECTSDEYKDDNTYPATFEQLEQEGLYDYANYPTTFEQLGEDGTFKTLWDKPYKSYRELSDRIVQTKMHDLLEKLYSEEFDPIKNYDAPVKAITYINQEIQEYTSHDISLTEMNIWTVDMAVKFGLLMYRSILEEIRDYIYENIVVESSTAGVDILKILHTQAWNVISNISIMMNKFTGPIVRCRFKNIPI